MRTYAPAATESVLADLLDEPSTRPRRRPPRGHPGPRGRVRGVTAAWLDPRIRGRPGRARDRAAVHPPGRRSRGGPCRARTSSSSRRPRRARRSATPCRSSRRSRTTRRLGPCSSSRPRRSGRTRSPSSRSSRGPRECRSRRRRMTATRPRPSARPSGRRGRSSSATRTCSTRRSCRTTRSGSSCSSSCGYRHRRAPHLPGRVREPRRQRHSPAAAAVRPLRQQPGHRLLLGDDREPGRAGGAVDGAAGAAHRPERGAGRRAPRAPRRPADPRRRDGRARIAP